MFLLLYVGVIARTGGAAKNLLTAHMDSAILAKSIENDTWERCTPLFYVKENRGMIGAEVRGIVPVSLGITSPPIRNLEAKGGMDALQNASSEGRPV